MSRTRKSLYLLLLLFLPLFSLLLTTSSPSVIATDPNITTDAEPYYLVSGDIVKNFKFESFTDSGGNIESIDQGGAAYDNRLKFEMEPIWQIKKEDLTLMQPHKVGNKMYYQYKLPMTTKVNIYTNVRLEDASEILNRGSKNYLAATYLHYPRGSDSYDSSSWRKDLTFYYYDFWEDSNLRDYNKRNRFEGNLVMTFDIDDSPLPDSLEDENGIRLVKEFDYVGVSSAAIISGKHGSMSNAPPEIHVSTPTYETAPVVDVIGDNPSGYVPSPGSEDEGYDYRHSFNTEAVISDAGFDTYSPGIQYVSTNASLNPTLKDGSDIFDNVAETQQSQTDCKLTYNIGSLAPTIYEYYNRLDWTAHGVECFEKRKATALTLVSPYLGYVDYREWRYTEEHYTKVKSSALHVQNNYIQCELQIVFNFFTAYEIQVLDTPGFEDYDLETSHEDYLNNTWNIASDGAVEGETTGYTEEPDPLFENPFDDWESPFDPEATSEWFNNVFMLLILVVVIIGVVVVLVIVIRFARPRPQYYEGRVVR